MENAQVFLDLKISLHILFMNRVTAHVQLLKNMGTSKETLFAMGKELVSTVNAKELPGLQNLLITTMMKSSILMDIV